MGVSRSLRVIDKIKEELAIEDPPDCSPDQVDRRRNSDETSPIMPDKATHYDRRGWYGEGAGMNAWVEREERWL